MSYLNKKNVELSKIDGYIYKIEYDFISKLVPYFFENKKEIKVLEIGSYKGKSTLMFLQSHPEVKITSIEPFCGPTDEDFTLKGKEFKNEFLHNTELYKDKITLLEKYSNDQTINDDLKNQSFDICFIDGDHAYESVQNDIDLCLKYLKDDGLLILDDYWIDCDEKFKFRGVRNAVNEKLLYKLKFLFIFRSMIVFQKNSNFKSYEL